MEKEFFNATEAAFYVGLTEKQIIRMTKKNEITFYNPVKNIILFKKADLDLFFSQNRTEKKENQKRGVIESLNTKILKYVIPGSDFYNSTDLIELLKTNDEICDYSDWNISKSLTFLFGKSICVHTSTGVKRGYFCTKTTTK